MSEPSKQDLKAVCVALKESRVPKLKTSGTKEELRWRLIELLKRLPLCEIPELFSKHKVLEDLSCFVWRDTSWESLLRYCQTNPEAEPYIHTGRCTDIVTYISTEPQRGVRMVSYREGRGTNPQLSLVFVRTSLYGDNYVYNFDQTVPTQLRWLLRQENLNEQSNR